MSRKKQEEKKKQKKKSVRETVRKRLQQLDHGARVRAWMLLHNLLIHPIAGVAWGIDPQAQWAERLHAWVPQWVPQDWND